MEQSTTANPTQLAQLMAFREDNKRLREENRILLSKVMQSRSLLELAVAEPQPDTLSQTYFLISQLQTENESLRSLLWLSNSESLDAQGHLYANGSHFPTSPSLQSLSSFHLTTPPRSPPTNTQRKADYSNRIRIETSVSQPAIFNEPDLTSDIADIGPPMSPPTGGYEGNRRRQSTDETEAERSDRAEFIQGTQEVDEHLAQ